MNHPHQSRRSFIRQSALTAATALGGFHLLPAAASGAAEKVAAHNRIQIGMIGMGRQAYHANLMPFLVSGDTQVVAVCDVDSWRAEQGRKKIEDYYAARQPNGRYRGCTVYRDFRELLARPDIDAVMISTPDHWHAAMAVEAAKAGKDIALEKPISLSIAQGRAISNAMTHYRRIFRTDTEVRFSGEFHRLCELVRHGHLGKIQRIFAGVVKEAQPVELPPAEPAPAELDYALWLGPAPEAPYCEKRVHSRHDLNSRPGWMIIMDYCDGVICNWGAHLLDIVQWANNTEYTGPVEIEGTGQFHPRGGLSNVLEDFEVRYRYANGVDLTYTMSGRPFVRIEGTAGWIEAEWWKGLQAQPAEILKIPRSNDGQLPLINEKIDFIQSVKNRRESLIPAEVGHRTNSMGQLGLIAIQSGQKLQWDPDRERFLNNDAANRRLNRPMRDGWHL